MIKPQMWGIVDAVFWFPDQIWPQYFPKGLPYPGCKKPTGQSRGLYHHGPRLVCDVDKHYYLLRSVHECEDKQCSVTQFRSDDDRVLDAMPDILKPLIPVQNSYRIGVSKALVNEIKRAMVNGIGASALERKLLASHQSTYLRKYEAFLSHVEFTRARNDKNPFVKKFELDSLG